MYKTTTKMARKQTLVLVMIVIINCDASVQDSYSKLQYGHRLDKKTITSFVDFSILDCAEECLRTTRCRSVSYYKGAHFCEINYENRSSARDRFVESSGWIYSEKEYWDIGRVYSCSASNSSINEKCKPLPMGRFECVVSDCGIPSHRGVNMSSVGRWDGIGIQRFMKLDCCQNYIQSGSRMFVCAPNGQWKTDLKCVIDHCASSPCKNGGNCTSNSTTFSCQCADGFFENTCEGCEKDWLEYKGHCYFHGTTELTWRETLMECETRSSKLVEIEDKEESIWLAKEFLDKATCTNYVYSDCKAWTGGNDILVDGDYKWHHSSSTMDFENWNQNQPNGNHNGEDQDCVELLKNDEWNDENCNTRNSFICEKTKT
ncbi:neurocan core protein-like [Ostrea edulis]|uniref:neurocan core protein-like n=1 Tax=Ostrea edulis TaxID=37623 RepID=UPI0024AED35B|nr:neurocan core protein-like [Ostrea edulis]